MQTGTRDSAPQAPPAEATSPSISRTASKPKAKGLRRPTLPDADQILRQDSWGSGTGGSTTSLEVTPNENDTNAAAPSDAPANE